MQEYATLVPSRTKTFVYRECKLLRAPSCVPLWELFLPKGSCFALSPRVACIQCLVNAGLHMPGPFISIMDICEAILPSELPVGSAQASVTPESQLNYSLSLIPLPLLPYRCCFPEDSINKSPVSKSQSQSVFPGKPDCMC